MGGDDMILGHFIPGFVFFLAACGVLCEKSKQGLFARDRVPLVIFIACCIMAPVQGTFADESFSHRFHHSLMYTSFAVAGLTNLAERHGYLLENASCLCWGSAFCIEGLLLLGHNSKTALEDRCHLFITITAFLSALGLWSI